MSWCRNCKVEIRDETEQCPLCHCVLNKKKNPENDGTYETDEKNEYPNVRIVTRKLRLFSNILLFCSLVICSLLLYIDYRLDGIALWSLAITMAFVFVNISFYLAVVGKFDYRHKLISLTTMSIVFLIVMDFATGYRGWSLNFFFPLGIILVDVAVFIMMFTNRRNWQSYLMLQIFMILLSLVPLVLLMVGIIQFRILTLSAFGLSLFLFLGTVIIGDQRARNELKRRFHL